MAVKLYVMKRDLGLSPGLTAPLLEFLSGDCSVFLFPPPDPLVVYTSSSRTTSLESGQSAGLDESCQTQFCQWRVLKAGVVDAEEKPACCCHITPQLCARRRRGGHIKMSVHSLWKQAVDICMFLSEAVYSLD